jgi:DNA polymerase-1
MQLVGPQVSLINPGDKIETLWGADEVRAKTGVEPAQIVDWLSLVGDSVDNIPGVPGVGSKTAADLLHQFGSISELFRRLAEVRSDRLRAALEASAELVRRNQELVRLNWEVPCGTNLEALTTKDCDNDMLRRLYSLWGFTSLLRELDLSGQKEGVLI